MPNEPCIGIGKNNTDPPSLIFILIIGIVESTHLAALYRSFLLPWESNLNQFPMLGPGFKIGAVRPIRNYGVNG